MTNRSYNVLFLCTGNSARSILAESILRKDGQGAFCAYSAGSTPNGSVNPLAIQTLENFGYPTDELRSKAWLEFAQPNAPAMDFIFTVCDNAAGEACPVWPGHPTTAHWGIEDPAKVTGSEYAKHAAFVVAFGFMKKRIGAFLSLPFASIDRLSLKTKLNDIGKIEGSTSPRNDVA